MLRFFPDDIILYSFRLLKKLLIAATTLGEYAVVPAAAVSEVYSSQGIFVRKSQQDNGNKANLLFS